MGVELQTKRVNIVGATKKFQPPPHFWSLNGVGQFFESLLVSCINLRENFKYTLKTFCNSENAPNFVRIPEIHPCLMLRKSYSGDTLSTSKNIHTIVGNGKPQEFLVLIHL